MSVARNSARPYAAVRRGFTLLEVLIATMAFAIVLAAINGVFYGGLRLRQKTVASLEKTLPWQYAWPVIKRDLANLLPPDGSLYGELQSTAVSSQGGAAVVSPEFYTASGMIDQSSPWPSAQKVSYALLASTNRPGSTDLYRLVQRNLLAPIEEAPAPQWLLGGVRQVTFFYLKDAQWVDTWDSTVEDTKLPAGLKMVIEREMEIGENRVPDPWEIVVPVLTQARTNATNDAEGQATGGQR